MSGTLFQASLGLMSGGIVGFSLGLVGGGGSILAVPLLVYLVGVASPHVAIGTSAVAVAANAAGNLAEHARLGHVRWRCAALFALAGVAGATVGSTLGKRVDGQALLSLFALLMLVIAALMFRRRGSDGEANVDLCRANAARLAVIGLGAGTLAGFFGIGGGFLVVPGLMLASRMRILDAIGSSLVAVTAFGLTTAANYALSGFVDWRLAALVIVGGLAGGRIGAHLAERLSMERGRLNVVFAGVVVIVALYMLARSRGMF